MKFAIALTIALVALFFAALAIELTMRLARRVRALERNNHWHTQTGKLQRPAGGEQ